jgi:signal transduction histidine kinase
MKDIHINPVGIGIQAMEDSGKDYKEIFNDISFMVPHRIRSPVATMQGLLELIRMNAFDQGELCQVYIYFEKCVIELETNCKELGEIVYRQPE